MATLLVRHALLNRLPATSREHHSFLDLAQNGTGSKHPYTRAVSEAPLDDSGSGLAPAGDGWFVVNARDAAWLTSENGEKQPSGSECSFESREVEFPQVGIR